MSTTTSSHSSSKLRETLAKAPQNSAYARHIEKCLQYLDYYGGSVPTISKGKTERDLLEEEFEFLRDDANDANNEVGDDSAKQIARKYYENLFREFALIDLSRWREGQVALRWRTKHEVLQGIGQFTCASLTCPRHTRPDAEEDIDDFSLDAKPKKQRDSKLESFEMNFGYVEKGVKKNALVKVHVCERCAEKLQKVKNPARRDEDRHRSKDRRSDRRRHRSRSRSQTGERDRRRRDDKDTTDTKSHRDRERDRDRYRQEDRSHHRKRSRSPKREADSQ